jgi:serine protease inhibitor
MRSYITYIIVILISVCAFPSCEESEPIQKETPKITLNKKAGEIIKADEAFGFELFREVYNLSEEDNIMISPLSVSYALGMTYNGAAGTYPSYQLHYREGFQEYFCRSRFWGRRSTNLLAG